MIKQIWFIRNITKLFVGLSFAINFVITLYCLFSALALTTIIQSESLISSMLNQYSGLLFFPFVGWVVFIFFFGVGIYLKRSRKKFLNHKSIFLTENVKNLSDDDIKKIKLNLSTKEETLLLFLSHFITSTNFSTSITFAFFSLDVVSRAKNIQSFGMLPIYICWGVTWYYYFVMISQLYKTKKELI